MQAARISDTVQCAWKKLPEFVKNPTPNIFLSDNYVILDFETTSIRKGLAIYKENSIVSVGWSLGSNHPRRKHDGERVQYKIGYKRAGEFELADLVQACVEADFIVAHNAKFDGAWLERCGLDLTNVLFYDTLLGEYVLGGNRWVYGQLSLDNISKRRFGTSKISIVSKLIKAGVCPSEIPASWLETYCIQDVELTEHLFLQQRKDLAELDLLPVLYNRCLLINVLIDIAPIGLCLDKDLVRTKLYEKEAEYAESNKKLDDITEGINLNSPVQRAEFLYEKLKFDPPRVRRGGKWEEDRTPSGIIKTDQGTIARLKGKTKKQKEFLKLYKENRILHNEITKYLRKFGDCCDDNGGILIANINQSNTRTHRTSSTGLDYSTQLQNLPRIFKALFRAREPDWLVGEADGSNLEFRIGVHLGRDGQGLSDILNPSFDAHTTSASEIYDIPYEVLYNAIKKKESWALKRRQDAKPETFGPLYGKTTGTPEQMRWIKAFQKRYMGIFNTQETWVYTVLEKKKLRTEWGLIYYWPDTQMDRGGYIKNRTSIFNYPVQAFATAEIIPLCLVYFWHLLKRTNLKMFLVNTVHDSIQAEFPKEEEKDFHDLSKFSLINCAYYGIKKLFGIDITVPLGCGVTTGSHWGSKNETPYDAEESLWYPAAMEAGML